MFTGLRTIKDSNPAVSQHRHASLNAYAIFAYPLDIALKCPYVRD